MFFAVLVGLTMNTIALLTSDHALKFYDSLRFCFSYKKNNNEKKTFLTKNVTTICETKSKGYTCI